MTQPHPPLIVGLAAPRASGKDTLCHLLTTLNPLVRRRAFGDAVKDDLAPFVFQHHGVDIHTVEGHDKEVLRPYLIAHGCAMRERDPEHWVKKVIAQIGAVWSQWPSYQEPLIPCVTDHRFPNEVKLMRETYGAAFRLISLAREGAPVPTDEEMKHTAKVAEMADFHLVWGNDTVARQLEHAATVLSWLGLAPKETDTATATP